MFREFGKSDTCDSEIKATMFENKLLDADDPSELFTSLLIGAAKEAIPQTTTFPKRPNKPWFTKECKTSIFQRKSALRQYSLRPTKENLIKFKIARARARKTIKESKRSS